MPGTVAWRGCSHIIKYHRNHPKPQTGVNTATVGGPRLYHTRKAMARIGIVHELYPLIQFEKLTIPTELQHTAVPLTIYPEDTRNNLSEEA